MNPDTAIAQLETQALKPGAFRHRDHVQMAWNYLQRFPLATAIDRYARALRAFATDAGHPEKYHETITWAYMLLVNERIQTAGPQSWDAFADDNPDLFCWPGGALERYYTRVTLDSPRARETFMMPDRIAP